MKNLGQVTENLDIARKQDIPTNTNQLTNGAGFITNSALSGYVPTSRKVNGKALSGNISLTASDVGALPSSTTIPTALSQLSADATHRTVTDTEKATWNSKSSFSGSYTDLTNKPTIPTVNNGTLTIQKNGTTVKTFTANQSSNVTANITVPTKTSDLTNDSGFITSDDLPSGGGSSSKTVTTLWSGTIGQNSGGYITLSQSMLNFDVLIFVMRDGVGMYTTDELYPSASFAVPVEIFALNEEVFNDLDNDTALLWSGLNCAVAYDVTNLTNTQIRIRRETMNPEIVKVVGVKY